MAAIKPVVLLAMDVDGTLTDGGIYISSDGTETKRYDVKDGLGIVTFRRKGGYVALISGRASGSTAVRSSELGVDYLYNGTDKKQEVLLDLTEKLGIDSSQVVYVGDDLNDIECIEWAGIGVCVRDGAEEARCSADWVTSSSGGRGAVREIIDRIIAEGLM